MPRTDDAVPPPHPNVAGEADVPAADDARAALDLGEFDMGEFDMEAALLAMSEDMGGPTTDVDLSTLSPTERQALLRYLRERLGIAAALV